MSTKNKTIIYLNEEHNRKRRECIEYQTSTSEIIQIPLYQFYKFSDIYDENLNLREITAKIKNKVQLLSQLEWTNEQSVSKFFLLLCEEKVEIMSENYWDLRKLSAIFQVSSLQPILSKYASDHKEDVDFIIALIERRERERQKSAATETETESEFLFLTENEHEEESSTDIEDLLKHKMKECLSNEHFGRLPICVIYRIIEQNNEEEIPHDMLYEFINKSIKERHLLYSFLNISKLSDIHFKSLYEHYKRRKETNTTHYYHFLKNDIEYIHYLKENQLNLENRIRTLEEDNDKKQQQIKSIETMKNKLEKQNQQLVEERKRLSDEKEKETCLNQKLSEKKDELEREKKALIDLETKHKEEISKLQSITKEKDEEINEMNNKMSKLISDQDIERNARSENEMSQKLIKVLYKYKGEIEECCSRNILFHKLMCQFCILLFIKTMKNLLNFLYHVKMSISMRHSFSLKF